MNVIIVDIAILIAALYLLFVAIKMKRTGIIPKIVMGEEMKKCCKDEKGFIDALYPWLMTFSIVALVCGAAGSVFDYLEFPTWSTIICQVIFLIVFITFMVVYKKAVKRFFDGL